MHTITWSGRAIANHLYDGAGSTGFVEIEGFEGLPIPSCIWNVAILPPRLLPSHRARWTRRYSYEPRIVVPDAGAYLRAFGQSWERLAAISQLEQTQEGWREKRYNYKGIINVYHTQMQLINEVFRQGNQHKYVPRRGDIRSWSFPTPGFQV